VSKKSDRSLTRFLGGFLRQKWVDRGEVWPLERLGPDWRFLLERIAGAKPSDNLDDRYRRALLNLLSNCQPAARRQAPAQHGQRGGSEGLGP
jgi:hypothetical protein